MQQVFASTVNEPDLIDKPIIFVLAKNELLPEKLLSLNKHASFPDYNSNPTDASKYPNNIKYYYLAYVIIERAEYMFSYFVYTKFKDADKSKLERLYRATNSLGAHTTLIVCTSLFWPWYVFLMLLR